MKQFILIIMLLFILKSYAQETAIANAFNSTKYNYNIDKERFYPQTKGEEEPLLIFKNDMTQQQTLLTNSTYKINIRVDFKLKDDEK